MHFFVALIETYGLFAVFLNLFIEGLGVPVPSYPLLMIAAALAPRLHYGLASVLLTGMAAALLADALWYWGGRVFGARIVKLMCRISLSPESCVQNTNLIFRKVGPSSLGFAKFIPGFSNVGIILASALRAPLLPVIFFDVLGTFIYITVGIVLGTVFHDAIATALDTLSTLGAGGVAILAGALGLFWLTKWLQRRRFMRELRMNRITVEELRALIDDGLSPVILDVRPSEVRLRAGVIPGSIVAHEGNIKALARRFAADSEVVVYCDCPDEASAVLMASKLRKAGFQKIRPLLGGLDAWLDAGHDVGYEAETQSLAA